MLKTTVRSTELADSTGSEKNDKTDALTPSPTPSPTPAPTPNPPPSPPSPPSLLPPRAAAAGAVVEAGKEAAAAGAVVEAGKEAATEGAVVEAGKEESVLQKLMEASEKASKPNAGHTEMHNAWKAVRAVVSALYIKPNSQTESAIQEVHDTIPPATKEGGGKCSKKSKRKRKRKKKKLTRKL